MLFVIFLMLFITRFIILYDLRFSIFSDILAIIGIYLVLRQCKNVKLKNVLFISILRIFVSLYNFLNNINLDIISGFLNILFCLFLFLGFSEIVHGKISLICKLTLTIAIIQVTGITIMASIWLIPPQITSRISWLFVYIGILITTLGLIIIKNIVKHFADN